jgi:cytochrome c-type biogenesis protein
VYSSSLVAAFLGGVAALFAPCCVVSLLPMFVGVALQRERRRLLLTTGLFAGGVGLVLLPIVLGVGALGQVLARAHRGVFFGVGTFLVVLAILTVAGRRWMLPVPELRLRTGGTGPGTVVLLGIASGVSSACCAPVLAGVVAMSALSVSVVGALGLGLAYVFGMVFPLFVAALAWDRFRVGDRLPYGGKAWGVRVGGRRIPWPDLVTAGMFLVVGGLALGVAAIGKSTYAPDALVAWNRWATAAAGRLAGALSGLPPSVQALALLALAFGIAAGARAAGRRAP